MPKENRSVRPSSSLPRTCSGDIYATVPSAVPGLVRLNAAASARVWESALTDLSPAAILANPKSRIFACPRLETKMFAGLISRNDSVRMRRVERISQLNGDSEQRVQFHRPYADQVL